MMKLYVTASLKAKEQLQAEAQAWARDIQATWVPRDGRTMEELSLRYGEALLVYTTRGPQLVRPEGTHFFSLNMAELRIQHIRKGDRDHFLEAIGVDSPIAFLDCTCGFGADSITAAFALPAGSVLHALEISQPLAAITQWGCRHFVHEKDDVTQALRRIQLTVGSFKDYLRNEAAPSYDVLYFDPMFTRPIEESCQFQPVRAIMSHDVLTADDIHLAIKKARKRVVIKARSLDDIKAAFPQLKQYGGKYSRVTYGVLPGEATR